MPKNLEQEFRTEIQQRRQQSRHEYWQSQWYQWRLILGCFTGAIVIFILATNGLYRLTQSHAPSSSASPSSSPAPKPSPKPEPLPLPLPPTGSLLKAWSGELPDSDRGYITVYARPPKEVEQSELGKTCPTSQANPSNYLIKVVDWQTNEMVQLVFVQSGERAKIDVPLGTYKLRYAAGEKWYGDTDRFGQQTRYGEFTEKNNSNLPTKFDIPEPGISWEMTVYSCSDGNMSNKEIRPDEF